MYNKIKKLAKKKGISLFALEKELGFGNGTITKWKVSSPTLDKVKKVADFFDVKIEDLLH